MNAVAGTFTGELVDDHTEFFAPVCSDMIGGLLGGYQSEKDKVEQFLAIYEANNMAGTIGYFCSRREDKVPSFSLDVAMCALNAKYWAKALALTDVYDAMPQKRRDEWNEQMRAWQEPRYRKGEKPELDLPDFIEDIVRPTLTTLLSSRAKFFAERVDGIFRSLSKAHVTNTPQGYSKRMILGGVLSYGSPDWSVCGQINDLRCIIAKFMGRDEPHHSATQPVVRAAQRRNGEWMTVDGGALRIRVYNGVGTAHLEVHPDMAWRLNAVLASIYPAAIPAEFRRKPVKAKKTKDFVLFDRPLPFVVVSSIADMKEARELIEGAHWRENKTRRIPNSLQCDHSHTRSKAAEREIENVMTAIGGVKVSRERAGSFFQFDYDPTLVIDEIVCSGCIPDHRSHQFYPTPDSVAQDAVAIATEGAAAGMWWLEPSAGIGNLADLFPEDANVHCYEISKLHCSIMEAKGYQRTGSKTIACVDFLKDVAENYRGGGYDRVVMNPPYSEGRWQAHTTAAAKTLKRGGVLVAILPSSAKGSFDLGAGWSTEWSRSYDNEFAGTSISVVIVKVTRI